LLNGSGVAFRQSTDPLIVGNRGTSTAFSLWQGQIDEVRYSDVAREFGEAPPVPEPTSVALFGVAGVMALARRRRS
jgi:hypothetical protein